MAHLRCRLQRPFWLVAACMIVEQVGVQQEGKLADMRGVPDRNAGCGAPRTCW
jgi:hypothetical protein